LQHAAFEGKAHNLGLMAKARPLLDGHSCCR
jgi:hypothetical protein